MFCPECGSSNQSGFKFCPNCGFEIGKIHLKNDNELNQIKVSTKIVDFPSEVWNKLVITKEDIDLFIEHGGYAGVWEDEDVIYTQEIIDIQNKFVLTKANIDLLISSINSDYNCIVDDEDNETHYFDFGQIKNGQKEGFVCQICGQKNDFNPEMKYVIYYSGSWVNDKREGFGIEINNQHLTPEYVGEWKDGSKHGNGINFYSRKEKYVGAWENDSYNGFGIKYYDNGEKQYEGQFKNDRLNGQGCSYFSSGVIRLQGLFENGKLLNGIEYYIDGQKSYEVTFKDGNIFNGIQYIDGVKLYEGDFKYSDDILVYQERGIYHGKGKYFYDDGAFEEGDFVNGALNGKGKYFYGDGRFEEGDFVNGELINGISYNIEGLKEYEGIFKDGNILNGISYVDGVKVYEGEFKFDEETSEEGIWHGKGKHIYGGGEVYEGDFVNGEFTGKGKVAYTDGSSYEGDFIDFKWNGKGKMIKTEGIYEGNFESGLPIGDFIFTNKEGNKINGHFKREDNQSLTFISNTSISSPILPKDGAGIR